METSQVMTKHLERSNTNDGIINKDLSKQLDSILQKINDKSKTNNYLIN